MHCSQMPALTQRIILTIDSYKCRLKLRCCINDSNTKCNITIGNVIFQNDKQHWVKL